MYHYIISKPKALPDYTRYVKYRNMYNKLKQIAKKTHYANQLNAFKNDSQKTWNLKEPYDWENNDKSGIPLHFIINHDIITNSNQISNAFCNFYFTNAGPKFANSIPRSKKVFFNLSSKLSKLNSNSLFMNPTDENEIQQILMFFPSKKCSGYYKLSELELKLFGKQIVLPLAILINKSMIEGIVPQELKIAKTIPVFKSKAKDYISNYRPISMLLSISKILGKMFIEGLIILYKTTKY